jgi:hypothetical protein
MHRLKFTETSSVLVANYFPPIRIEENTACGLLHFSTYNSIRNIDHKKYFYFEGFPRVHIPSGAIRLKITQKLTFVPN